LYSNTTSVFVSNDAVPARQLAGQSWDEWVQSVKLNPQPLQRMRLLTISELLPATSPIRANLDRAVADYANAHAPPVTPPQAPTSLALKNCNCVDLSTGSDPADSGITIPIVIQVGVEDASSSDQYFGNPQTVCQLCNTMQYAFGQTATQTRKRHPQSLISSGCNSSSPSPSRVLPIPGADTIGLGFDAISGVTRYMPIINLTFAMAQTTSVVFGCGAKRTYLVPDQVSVTPATKSGDLWKIFASTSDVAEHHASQAGLDMSLPFASAFFSTSAEVARHTDAFGLAQSFVVHHSNDLQEYDMIITALAPNTSDSFSELVDRLLAPGYDVARYQQFVDIFGTHVIVQGSFGGKYDHTVTVDNNWASTHSLAEAQLQATVQWNFFQVGASANNSNTEDFAHFQKSSFAEVVFQGGNYEIATPEHYDAWYQSIADAPVLVSIGQLAPVTDFIPNGPIQSLLAAHIDALFKNASARALKKAAETVLLTSYSWEISAVPSGHGYDNVLACDTTRAPGAVIGSFFSSRPGNAYWESVKCTWPYVNSTAYEIGPCDTPPWLAPVTGDDFLNCGYSAGNWGALSAVQSFAGYQDYYLVPFDANGAPSTACQSFCLRRL
jgi:hypothetical protein